MESFWPMIRPSDLTFIFHGDIMSSNVHEREREMYIRDEGCTGSKGWMRVSLIQLAWCLRFPS